MAEQVYNWAKMCTVGATPDNANMSNNDVARLKNLYKTVWKSTLKGLASSEELDNSFENFFKECLTGSIKDLPTPKTNKGVPVKGADGLQILEYSVDKEGKNLPRQVDGDVFKDKLMVEYRRLTKLNGQEKDLDNQTFMAAMKTADPQMLGGDGKTQVPDTELKAALEMIATQYGRTDCINSDTHMAAGFLTGLGYHLQQGCGQGKSSAVATAAYMKRGKNASRQMFVTSSTKELALQSFSDIMGYFDDLGIGKKGEPERIFLMTKNGPKVAVRTEKGEVLNNNLKNGTKNIGFDDTQSCETEDVRFVVEGNNVRLAKRSDKNPKLDKEGKVIPNRLGWEEPSFTYAELASKPNGKQLQNQALQAIYGDKENIIIADNATIVQDNMKGVIPSKDKDGNEIARHVMMDEGDYVKNDQFHYLQQVGDAYEKKDQIRRNGVPKTVGKDGRVIEWAEKGLRAKARDLIVSLDLKNNPSLIERDKDSQYARFTEFGINAVKSYCKNNHIELTNEMMNLIDEALVVETVFVQNVDYVIEGGKVISQAKASGSEMELPEGIAQALAIKHGFVPEEEKRVFNIQTIMGAYDKIFGPNGQTRLSGTHEAETLRGKDGRVVTVANREMPGLPQTEKVNEEKGKKNYVGAVNAYFQNTRTRTLLENQDQIDEAIMVETDIVLQGGRPVLIGCVASQDVEAIKKQLKSKYATKEDKGKSGIVEQWGTGEDAKTVITYTAEAAKQYETDLEKMSETDFKAKYHIPADEKMEDFDKYDKFVKKMGGKKNTIVLGTSIVGRGANIKVGGTNAQGGLHVITRGLHPSSVRQMVQFINRSKRGADNGSSHEYFSLQEVERRVPDIEAAIQQNKEELLLLENATDPESVARRQQLTEENEEFLAVLKLLPTKRQEKSKTPRVTAGKFSAHTGAKGLMDMLEDKSISILVDNDGNPTQETGKTGASQTVYHGYYGVADRRNRMLAEKARAVEAQVTTVLESLKKTILALDIPIQDKAKIAKDIVPEYMGRALQIQYKANGHTRQKITEQIKDEIALVGLICQAKAQDLASGKEPNETEILKKLLKEGMTNQRTAKRIFTLSEFDEETMATENAAEGDKAVETVIKATVETLSEDQIKAAYAEMNQAGAALGVPGKKVDPQEIIEAIKSGKVTYEKVVSAIARVQAATQGKQGPEVGNIKE